MAEPQVELLHYRKLRRYKYQVMSSYEYIVPEGFLISKSPLMTTDEWVSLIVPPKGPRVLLILRGYCWDGPSGPTPDTLLPSLYEKYMSDYLVHDALYQLFREHPDFRKFRNDADRLLRKGCRAHGMWTIRARGTYWAVKTWGRRSAE